MLRIDLMEGLPVFNEQNNDLIDPGYIVQEELYITIKKQTLTSDN